VKDMTWWLGWQHVEALMLSLLTVPQRGGHPVVLPPVAGFQCGFCSTMEVDNVAVRQRDVVIILRFEHREGALALPKSRDRMVRWRRH